MQESALLGTLPDWEVANRTGHPLGSVRVRRTALGIAKWTGEYNAKTRPGKRPGA